FSNTFYYWTKGYGMAREKHQRLTLIVRKFLDDMAIGKYEVIDVPYIWRTKRVIERREVAAFPYCPRGISHCPGSYYRGGCPRDYPKCEDSARELNYGKRTHRRDLGGVGEVSLSGPDGEAHGGREGFDSLVSGYPGTDSPLH